MKTKIFTFVMGASSEFVTGVDRLEEELNKFLKDKEYVSSHAIEISKIGVLIIFYRNGGDPESGA